MTTPVDVITTRKVEANGLTMNIAVAGQGPAVVLVHGFPHTWQLWSRIIPELAATRTVIAPDLRGLGGTTRASGGYDAETIVTDLVALFDALEVDSADVVGIDLGAPPAFLLALTHPDRVRRLVVLESLIGTLPGAESFLSNGEPWWFGFHSVPGLAEHVLVGGEGAYLDFFLDAGTRGRGVEAGFRDAVVAAYSGSESLRCAFEYYRALPVSAEQILAATAVWRLTVATMAIGAFPVGAATYRQLRPLADDLVGHVIEDCGHIVPQDRPHELVGLLTPFLA